VVIFLVVHHIEMCKPSQNTLHWVHLVLCLLSNNVGFVIL